MSKIMKLKALKVFLNGEYMHKVYPYATKWQVIKYRIMKGLRSLCKWTVGLAVGTAVMYGFFYAGQELRPEVTHAEPTKAIAPILKKIAQAESHSSHYCTTELIKSGLCAKGERGQVLTNANANGTVDIGKYQINTYYWGGTAADMGFNLSNEDDNEDFAIWLFENYGSEPWGASKNNWK